MNAVAMTITVFVRSEIKHDLITFYDKTTEIRKNKTKLQDIQKDLHIKDPIECDAMIYYMSDIRDVFDQTCGKSYSFVEIEVIGYDCDMEHMLQKMIRKFNRLFFTRLRFYYKKIDIQSKTFVNTDVRGIFIPNRYYCFLKDLNENRMVEDSDFFAANREEIVSSVKKALYGLYDKDSDRKHILPLQDILDRIDGETDVKKINQELQKEHIMLVIHRFQQYEQKWRDKRYL